jgi:hypothetical protein
MVQVNQAENTPLRQLGRLLAVSGSPSAIRAHAKRTWKPTISQIVKIGEPFTIGGYECDYPGDDALPSEERCRCRCTLIAAFAGDQGDDN